MSAYLSKNEYANMKLVPGLLCSIGAIGAYMIYDSYTGFSAFLTGILFVPMAVILAYFGLVNLKKYYEITQVPLEQWDEYIKKERILFSKAVYVHPQTGDVQTVRRGFSIPVFLFGGFVPLVKGQFSMAIKLLLIVSVLDVLGSVIPIVGNIIAHVLSSYGIARRYNKYYEDYLIEQGYIIQDAHSGFNSISRAKEVTRNVLKADSVSSVYNEVKKEYITAKAISETSENQEKNIYEREYNKNQPNPSVIKEKKNNQLLFIIGGLSILSVIGYSIYDKTNKEENPFGSSKKENYKQSNQGDQITVNQIKKNTDNKIVAETEDVIYYLGVQEYTLYKYDKKEAYTKTFSFEDAGMFAGVKTMFFEDGIIVLIGDNNALGMSAGDVAVFFDIQSEKFVKHFWGRKIEKSGHYLIADYDEIVIDKGYSAGNEYFSYKELYDLKGNLIDGKKIRGIGAIGKYPIEMSFHILEGQVAGWYKYEGHTNYMTIKGYINNMGTFDFVEYNDKMESYGRFTGQADFEQQTLSGVWEKDNKQLDFFIGKKEQMINNNRFDTGYYEGSMAGFPISLNLTINVDGNISGQYKNIKYGTVLSLSGNIDSSGNLKITASNHSETIYFTLSHNNASLEGYGSNGSNQLDVHLIKKDDLLTIDDQSQLKSLTRKWNDRHTLQEYDLYELKSLYADQVFFYGQTLNSDKCIQLIKQTLEKYNTYSQKLVSDLSFTILDNNLIKCDFTKRVETDGKSKDYEGYLIFRKTDDCWAIETESDKATDAYFERLKEKKK